MLVAVRRHDGLKVCRDELDALSLETVSAVLLRQGQSRRHRVDADAIVEPVLASQLDPVDPVPVRRRKKVLRCGHPAVVLRFRRRVGVDEAEHGSEDRGIHVLDLDALRSLLLHVAEELGHEDRGP